mgnify:CR=1 FL=1
MSYFDIYQLRVNRYGLDYQSRIQGKREQNFDLYLQKSIYRVDFEYNDEYINFNNVIVIYTVKENNIGFINKNVDSDVIYFDKVNA